MSEPHLPSAFPEIVAGRYRLLRELGRGGMGAVYEAEHTNTGERVALKTMLVGSTDAEFVERFRREARAFAKIGGEHVVRVIDADTAPELNGAPFLVMELLNGSDLSHMLETKGRLSPELVVKYLSQTGAAIERAHAAGLIHRDLKPENIFVHQTVEGREIVKVLDFGIAKAFEHTALTKPGALVGTPHYMAPEQARGETDAICPQTDVWALGMIGVELLTGEPYWRASSVVQLFTQIMTEPMLPPLTRWGFLPQGFDAWFARSCAREIGSRWPSVRVQMDELREALRAGERSLESDLTRVAPPPTVAASNVTAQLPPQPHAAPPAAAVEPRISEFPPPPVVALARAPAVPPPVAALARPSKGKHPDREKLVAVGAMGAVSLLVVAGVVVAILSSSSTAISQPPAVQPPAVQLPAVQLPALQLPVVNAPVHVDAAGTGAALPSPGCDPPYWFDPQGAKHYKPQCPDEVSPDLNKNPYR